MDSRFDKVAEALADEITKGDELGASIAVDIDRQCVVDIWGSHADRDRTNPWVRDRIVNFWRFTKPLTARRDGHRPGALDPRGEALLPGRLGGSTAVMTSTAERHDLPNKPDGSRHHRNRSQQPLHELVYEALA